MRLLHTSDWHLGRSFHGVGLLDVQAVFVDHLVEVVRSEGVDAVVVSGDVYDRALPAPDTVTLLSEAVTRLVDAGASVVLSSGNHDSAIRLGFASELLSRAGLHIRSSVDGITAPVVVDGVAIHAIPFLEPSQAAPVLGTAERTHAAVLGAAMERIRAASTGLPVVVMAHAFVTGAATSESERDISAGGVSAVHPSVFEGIAYGALGHLHRPQQVGDSVRYSGSPQALSFSEAGQVKETLLVDLDASGVRSVTSVPVPVVRPLATVRGPLEELLTSPEHEVEANAWVQATLTDAVRPPGAMERLRRRFPGTLDLRFEPVGAPVDVRTYAARLGSAPAPLDVCCDFLTHVRGGHSASEAERALLATAVEESRIDRHESEDRVRADRRRSAGAA
jgi:exonuclease SbcD